MPVRYPEVDKIPDPPELPPDLVASITPTATRAVIRFRKAQGASRDVLADAAVEILEVLLARRLGENHPTMESFHKAVEEDVDTALAYAHHIHKQAGYGRMLFIWHRGITEILFASRQVEEAETKWWERQLNSIDPAGTTPAGQKAPTRRAVGGQGSVPRHPSTPNTSTARRIEAFRQRIEAADGRNVRTLDMVAFCRYKDATMFQRVQREAKNASAAAIEAVERMLACRSADDFWRIAGANSKKK